MSGFLDTPVVVRYLVGVPPDQARRAARIIDSQDALFITDVVIAEAAHVLRTFYAVPRDTIIDQLILLVKKENIRPHILDKSLVVQALGFCRGSGRVSITDALLWAAARTAGPPRVYTFDRRFP